MYNCLLVYFLLHFARSDFKKEICDVLREQKEKRDIEKGNVVFDESDEFDEHDFWPLTVLSHNASKKRSISCMWPIVISSSPAFYMFCLPFHSFSFRLLVLFSPPVALLPHTVTTEHRVVKLGKY